MCTIVIMLKIVRCEIIFSREKGWVWFPVGDSVSFNYFYIIWYSEFFINPANDFCPQWDFWKSVFLIDVSLNANAWMWNEMDLNEPEMDRVWTHSQSQPGFPPWNVNKQNIWKQNCVAGCFFFLCGFVRRCM